MVRMRVSLWPDCSAVMHRYEMRLFGQTSRVRGIGVIYRVEGGLGGFLELSVRPRVDGSMSARVGYVEGWHLDRDLRGKGWGRTMFEVAEAWTARRSLSELASDAELANPDGIRAHRACGFRETFRVVQFLRKVRH